LSENKKVFWNKSKSKIIMKIKTALTFFSVLIFTVGIAQQLPVVMIKTPVGNIVCAIDTMNAPVTSANFLKHIKEGTFNRALFYRTVRTDNQPNNDIKIEVIQGGVFTEVRFEKIKPIIHEPTNKTGLKHLDGTLSMARMEPGTASTEFFICVGDQPELDFGGKRNPDGQGFAAFGKVVDGMDVVRKIHQQKDNNQTMVEKVKILSIEQLK
jgi:peptidyl-prolyl cis-trans isomerase A (cyclophilin A)